MDLGRGQSPSSLRLVSFEHKIESLFEEENSQVPTEVGYISLAAVPLLLVAQQFLLRNYFGLNLLNGEEWFPSLVSFITFVSFYLPDLLLFLSGLHLAKPKTRLSYVVPLYLLCLLMLLAVKEMKLDSRPVWYVYNDMTCDWLGEALLVGGGCPWLGFYPRTEIIGILFSCLVLLAAQKSYRLAMTLVLAALGGSFALMLIFERGMPHSFVSLQNPQLFKYYGSSWAHLFFYILGRSLSMAKAYFPKALDRIVCSPLCRAAGLVSFAGACVLVGLVPWRWPGAYGFEFTISRIGFVLMSLPLVGRSFRTSMSRSKTIIHKLAGLAYPTLLVSSAVLPLSALAVGGLNYVSSSSVLSLLVGELPLCLALGVLVQLLIDFRLAMPAQF